MASPAEKLAQSLEILKSLQHATTGASRAALHTSDFSRVHRERLLKNGFIREVIKGWYIPVRPDATGAALAAGESTDWYSAFWPFCTAYLNQRFGQDWCLSAEHSIALHAGNWNVPRQLLVRAPKGSNKPTVLLHGTSIFDIRLDLHAAKDRQTLDGVSVMRLPAALLACAPGQFAAQPVEMRSVLAMLTNVSELLSLLLAGGHSSIAGRLAGAFRNIGRDALAQEITATMRAAGYSVNETDPFNDRPFIRFESSVTSAAVHRLRLSWANWRDTVLARFPAAPGLVGKASAYLQAVAETYASDAYHSLSIEGYQVSNELIERVRSGSWNLNEARDRAQRDALAARGYWQAFSQVKNSVAKILAGQNSGQVVQQDHGSWYRELFAPSVSAGLLQAADLAGYRNAPVFIRQSLYVPPRSEAVRELMPALFELLAAEPEAAVRVVLGHFFFVHIHPYSDGNGRIARFLMNTMLASGGYSWTVIPVTERARYMAALEAASVQQDIAPFTEFLAELINAAGKH